MIRLRAVTEAETEVALFNRKRNFSWFLSVIIFACIESLLVASASADSTITPA
jgi:hypothetical protein